MFATTLRRDNKIAVSIDTERHMKQQRKHDLEFFEDAPWPVRVRVLAMRYVFFLILAALISGPVIDLKQQVLSLLKGVL